VISKRTIVNVLLPLALCGSSVGAGIIGPVDASQLPNGGTLYTAAGGAGFSYMFYCNGVFETTDCNQGFAANAAISGNTGTNDWVITNILNPECCGGTITEIDLAFDPADYYPSLPQPSSVFFSSLLGPTYISGPVPTTLAYTNGIGLTPTPSPGPGLFWDLQITWAPGTFTPGSTLVISAPLFTETPEPSPFLLTSIGILGAIMIRKRISGRSCL
jgi:hypothetical protein